MSGEIFVEVYEIFLVDVRIGRKKVPF